MPSRAARHSFTTKPWSLSNPTKSDLPAIQQWILLLVDEIRFVIIHLGMETTKWVRCTKPFNMTNERNMARKKWTAVGQVFVVRYALFILCHNRNILHTYSRCISDMGIPVRTVRENGKTASVVVFYDPDCMYWELVLLVDKNVQIGQVTLCRPAVDTTVTPSLDSIGEMHRNEKFTGGGGVYFLILRLRNWMIRYIIQLGYLSLRYECLRRY